MAYCRFSSMNWMCDVYVYEHYAGGWTTHVAARHRLIPPIPDIPIAWFPSFGGKWDSDKRAMIYPSKKHRIAAQISFTISLWWRRYIHGGTLALIPLYNINLPFAGETFSDETAFACSARLIALREIGYRVPLSVITKLKYEMP